MVCMSSESHTVTRSSACSSSMMATLSWCCSTAIQRKQFLTDMIMKDIEASRTDKLKALDILNKMDGEYITKIEGNLDLSEIRVEIRDE